MNFSRKAVWLACLTLSQPILLSQLQASEVTTNTDQVEQNSKGESSESVATSFHQLEAITVIATKTPKAPLDAPASVSIIAEEEISAFNSEHPFKPLVRTEGVWPRQYRGLADYWARPVVRGYRALVMVDGLNWYDYGRFLLPSARPKAYWQFRVWGFWDLVSSPPTLNGGFY